MSKPFLDLHGQVAVVTGSTSGIGLATARLLHELGAAVVVNSARSVEAGEALAVELASARHDGPRPTASYVQADVSNTEEVSDLIEKVLDTHGRLDILVNNAGKTKVIPHADLAAASIDVWRDIFEVNVFGTWQLSVAAVPHLRSSENGVVVNVSSIAGHRPTGSSIPYAASKAALSHMTLLLANALGPDIRVNAVAPGLVDTPWTADWDDVRAGVVAGAPLRRSGLPEDVAHVIAALVGARYVTGEVVLVDGGLHLR